MKDKILFWLDMEWIRFGIAKFLQESYDCDLYAVLDTDKVATDFYKRQDIVKFHKVWYYRDYILKNDKKVDIEYLKKFEEKYNIHLWQLAYSERFFYKYNIYHKFKYGEILTILEQECRLFEKILDEIQPNCLIIKLTDTHQSQIMHQLCKARGIKILMMNPTRFAYHFIISEDHDVLNNFDVNGDYGKKRSLSELQDYLKKNHTINQTKEFASKLRIPKWRHIQKYLYFLSKTRDADFKKSYANYGKTTIKTITQFLFLKKFLRKRFIDQNSITELSYDASYVFFPLQTEPERTLLVGAPFYTDQISLITRIAKALPVGFKLYVKEHVSMGMFGWRKISFYKQILELPNVCLIHPFSMKPEELISKCSLVTTIIGTLGIEAAFYEKPTIVFTDTSYSTLPSVDRVHDLEDLPNIIRNMLNTKVDLNALNNYVNYVENNSFVINLLDVYTDLHKYFFKEFNKIGGNISNLKMRSFLERHRQQFEQISLEHLKIINSSKHA